MSQQNLVPKSGSSTDDADEEVPSCSTSSGLPVELRKAKTDNWRNSKVRRLDADESSSIPSSSSCVQQSSTSQHQTGGADADDTSIESPSRFSSDEQEEAPEDPVPTGPTLSEASLSRIVQHMCSDDYQRQLTALKVVRSVLSRNPDAPIDLIIQSGFVPRCVHFLEAGHPADLQFEAAWALTNITGGTELETRVVVGAGAIDPLIELMQSPDIRIPEQAIWVLGNIAGDDPSLRDLIISKDLIPRLIALVTFPPISEFLIQNAAWVMYNLCRYEFRPSAPQAATVMFLPLLCNLIMITEIPVLVDVCSAISFLTRGAPDIFEQLIKADVLTRMLELLENCANEIVISACIRTLAEICTGTTSQAEYVAESGFFPLLARHLQSTNNKIVLEAASGLSTVAAQSEALVTDIIHAEIVPPLLALFGNGDFRAQKHALCALTTMITRGNRDHLIYLVQNEAIEPMCEMLKCKNESNVLLAILEALKRILKDARNQDYLKDTLTAIEESGGLGLMEQLQTHENEVICTSVVAVLDLFAEYDRKPIKPKYPEFCTE